MVLQIQLVNTVSPSLHTSQVGNTIGVIGHVSLHTITTLQLETGA